MDDDSDTDRGIEQGEEHPLANAARRRFLIGTGVLTSSLAAPCVGAVGAKEEARSTPHIPGRTARVRFNLNGHDHDLDLDPRVTLLDALREHLSLTGTKKGCDRGQCGACTVLVDGRRVNACLMLAVTLEGARVVTIEGLGRESALHPMQQAFLNHDAFQCGYCTPGQICSAVALLDEAASGAVSTATGDVRNPGRVALSDDEIRERMSGNLCRCGAYVNIVAAVRDASRVRP